jgi:hypothetical protein
MEHPEEGDMNVVLSSEEQRHLAERVQQLLLTYPEAGNDLDYYKFSGIPGFFDERIGVDMEKSDLPRGIRSWEFLGILTPQRANAQEAILGSFYLAKDANNPAITNLTFDFDWAHIAEEHPEDYQNFFRGLRDFLLRLI